MPLCLCIRPVTAHLMGLHSAIKMLQQQLLTLQQLVARVNSGEGPAPRFSNPAARHSCLVLCF